MVRIVLNLSAPIRNRVHPFIHVINSSNFVSTQYFENKLIGLDNILGLYCYV